MIREYRPADREEVVNVWAAASALAHPFFSRELFARERDNIRAVHLANAETWVWEADGQVVGFIALLGNEVGGLFVDPRHHRSGIGRALMDRARALRGELEVEVFKANALGRAFYARYGFEPIGEKIDQHTGFEVIRLRLV